MFIQKRIKWFWATKWLQFFFVYCSTHRSGKNNFVPHFPHSHICRSINHTFIPFRCLRPLLLLAYQLTWIFPLLLLAAFFHCIWLLLLLCFVLCRHRWWRLMFSQRFGQQNLFVNWARQNVRCCWGWCGVRLWVHFCDSSRCRPPWQFIRLCHWHIGDILLLLLHCFVVVVVGLTSAHCGCCCQVGIAVASSIPLRLRHQNPFCSSDLCACCYYWHCCCCFHLLQTIIIIIN